MNQYYKKLSLFTFLSFLLLSVFAIESKADIFSKDKDSDGTYIRVTEIEGVSSRNNPVRRFESCPLTVQHDRPDKRCELLGPRGYQEGYTKEEWNQAWYKELGDTTASSVGFSFPVAVGGTVGFFSAATAASLAWLAGASQLTTNGIAIVGTLIGAGTTGGAVSRIKQLNPRHQYRDLRVAYAEVFDDEKKVETGFTAQTFKAHLDKVLHVIHRD